MKKIFISADIEGTCGISAWPQTDNNHSEYPQFAERMTQEVRSACLGAASEGVEAILVKDAHGSGRNLYTEKLPKIARVFQGWGNGPFNMMEGLDETFAGVFLTGYHAGASMGGNPLAHTMNTGNVSVYINDETASEMMISAYTAAMLRVPLLMVTGDEKLCQAVKKISPNSITVPVSIGIGAGSVALHPEKAQEEIYLGAIRAMQTAPESCIIPLPEVFSIRIIYRDHAKARTCSFFPGAKHIESNTVEYTCQSFYDALVFFQFCL